MKKKESHKEEKKEHKHEMSCKLAKEPKGMKKDHKKK